MTRRFIVHKGLTALALSAIVAASAADELCAVPSVTYASAKHELPQTGMALSIMQHFSVATWYTDRASSGDYAATAKQLVTACNPESKLNVVVYGLPNKDCEAGASTAGSRNTNAAEYEIFIKTLVNTVGGRKALYVVEPDAVGLVAKEGGCGQGAGYLPNIKTAITLLSANPNAEIYVDVGYWALAYEEPRRRVASIIRELQRAGPIRGISLNTANYRPTDEIESLCRAFQDTIGSTDLHCVVDTSRNYNDNVASDEWCNLKSAGIGHPPTSETGYSNLDYFVWLKPAGESDGDCAGRTSDAMAGAPAPGEFFFDAFKALWNQGYFVQKLKMPAITDAAMPVAPAPTTSQTPPPTTPDTAAPTTPEMPKPTLLTPVTPMPSSEEPIVEPSPIIQRPAAPAPSPSGLDIAPSRPSSSSSSIGNEDDSSDESPIQIEVPSALPVITRPTPAPTVPRPTPAATTSLRSTTDDAPPSAATQTNIKGGSLGKSLLSGAVVLFAVSASVLGIAIMVNRARQKKLQALEDKHEAFVVNGSPRGYAELSMLTLTPDHYRPL